jgi:hypothetical protein
VTVRATNFTFVDLVLDGFETVTLIDHLGYIHLLRTSHMVKGQNKWITLTAVNAGVAAQISKYKVPCFFPFIYLPRSLVFYSFSLFLR